MTGTPDLRGLSRAEPGTRIPLPARRWRTRVLVPAGVLTAVVGLLLYATWDTIVPATEVRAVPVIVKSLAGSTPGSVTVQAPGWLEPDPHPYYVPALTDGVVAEVLVLEGEPVEAGQIVARLIDADARLEHERAAAAVDESRSAVERAKAELEAARATMDNLVARTAAVATATAELEAVEAEQAQLTARIAAARARALATEDELDRKSELVASQAVPRGEVERLRLRLAAERAELDAVSASVPVLAARRDVAEARRAAAVRHRELLIEERRALRQAEAGLAAARASERRAVAALGEAELRLARTEVRAEVDGIVLQRRVSPGSRVQTGSVEHSTHIVHLYDPAKLQVRVDVPLVDAARVGVGQTAEIVVDALPDEVFAGIVTRLVHVADVAKNTVEVKVAVTAPNAVLKPEMLARVRFLAADRGDPGGEVRQRVLAPRDALRGDTVLVVGARSDRRGYVESRTVTVGSLEVDDWVEITSGLRPGDRVIVDAPAGLDPGDRVIMAPARGND